MLPEKWMRLDQVLLLGSCIPGFVALRNTWDETPRTDTWRGTSHGVGSDGKLEARWKHRDQLVVAQRSVPFIHLLFPMTSLKFKLIKIKYGIASRICIQY